MDHSTMRKLIKAATLFLLVLTTYIGRGRLGGNGR